MRKKILLLPKSVIKSWLSNIRIFSRRWTKKEMWITSKDWQIMNSGSLNFYIISEILRHKDTNLIQPEERTLSNSWHSSEFRWCFAALSTWLRLASSDKGSSSHQMGVSLVSWSSWARSDTSNNRPAFVLMQIIATLLCNPEKLILMSLFSPLWNFPFLLPVLGGREEESKRGG